MPPDATPPDGLEPMSSSAFLAHLGPLYLDPSATAPTYWTKVEAHHANTFGAAHGGFVAAIVDVVAGRGTRKLLADGRDFRTVSMTIDYPAGAELGDWICATMTLDHLARRTAFVTCRVTCGERLVARATVVLSASSAPAVDGEVSAASPAR